MPPVLDPSKSQVDGLAFIGLSLSRKSEVGHPDSATHQEAFDLNEVLDREYKYIYSTNDDGWLVGGGEPGPPHSYKLAAKDSAHVELMRIGTHKPEWGGIKQEDIVEAIDSGKILIPQIEVLPTDVIANPDHPPELEIRFDMVPNHICDIMDCSKPLPINWALRFIHNQLFKHFEFPSRFCPGAFHSTIVRKAEFRSDDLRRNYFEQCRVAIEKWHEAGPQPLNQGWDIDGTKLENPPEHTSGLWLFTDRENISHSLHPNFLPPYDTPEKRQIIADFLNEEWDQKALCWKEIGYREREVAAEAIRKAEARTRAEQLRRELAVEEEPTKEEEKKPESDDPLDQYALIPLAALKDRTPSTKIVIKTFKDFIGDVKGAHQAASEELALLLEELEL